MCKNISGSLAIEKYFNLKSMKRWMEGLVTEQYDLRNRVHSPASFLTKNQEMGKKKKKNLETLYSVHS